MNRKFSIAVLLTIFMGLMPSSLAFSQTYTISPTDYPNKAPSPQSAGSWTGYLKDSSGKASVWIESKAVQSGSLINYYVKKNSGTFLNDATFRVMRDVKISGSSVTSEGTQVAESSISAETRGNKASFKPASGTHEYRAIVSSGKYTYFTDPITIKGNEYTEQANLVLTSSPSFGTTSMIKGKSYTFSVNVKNNGSSTWKGGFYLKNGDETLIKWGKSISSGAVIYLSGTYTPTTTGNMTLELFYQTDEVGKGRTVPSGSYSNPFTVNVTQSGYTEQANLVLTSSPSFGTTSMIKGKSYTFSVNVKNNGSSTWKGGFYLKNGDETLIKWGKSISSGAVIYLSGTYTPTTTGNMTLELFYQTDEVGKGRTVPSGSYSNPFTVNVTSETTQQADLVLYSAPSFKTLNQSTLDLMKGESYTFSVKVKNNGSSSWKGAFYLKNGSNTLLSWSKEIASGASVTLSDSYTPTSVGSISLELFYQTDGHGSGISVNKGSYSNPFTVNVSQGSSTTLDPPNYNTISLSQLSSTGVTVSWGEVTGATLYDVHVSSTSSFTNVKTGYGRPGSTYYSFTGLQSNTTYYLRIRAKNSSQTSSWTKTYTFKTSATNNENELTEVANLYLYDRNGFGTSAMIMGNTYHYKTGIENRSNTAWTGSFYLKDGDNVVKSWSEPISKWGAKYLEFDYKPTTIGTKQLTLYYQTATHGGGRPVNKGNFVNPITLTIGQDPTVNNNLKLAVSIVCPSTIELGKSCSLAASVKNAGNDKWSGTLYLKDNNVTLTYKKVELAGGGSAPISLSSWTPQTTGSHNISVYYKSDNGTAQQPVSANGFSNPVTVNVTNSSSKTIASYAHVTCVSKDVAPQEVTEGSEVYYHYLITDDNDNPLKGMKVVFECSGGNSAKKQIETEASDEDGYATLRIQTDGDDAIAARGQTVKMRCNSLIDSKNKAVQFMYIGGDTNLTIHEGTEDSRESGFENVEKLELTLSGGGSVSTELSKYISAKLSASIPITLGLKWDDAGNINDYSLKASIKADGSVSLGKGDKESKSKWLKYVPDGKFGVSVGLKRGFSTDNPWAAIKAYVINWCESYTEGTDKEIDKVVKVMKNLYGGKYEKKYTKSWYYGGSGEISGDILNVWPGANGLVRRTTFPRLTLDELNLSVGGSYTIEPSKEKTEGGRTLTGSSSTLKVSGSFNASGQIKDYLLQTRSWWKTSVMGGFFTRKLGDLYKDFNTKNYDLSLSIEHEEFFDNNGALQEVSQEMSFNTGWERSTDELKILGWTPFGGSIGITNTWKSKVSSKGAWASYLGDKIKYNATDKESVFQIFPNLSGNSIICSPREIYHSWTHDFDGPMGQLSKGLTNTGKYKLNEALKVEQSVSSELDMAVHIPIFDWEINILGWKKKLELSLDVGATVGIENMPSESYYSVTDKRFFPVTLRPSTSIQKIAAWMTKKISNSFLGIFDDDEEEIKEEYVRMEDLYGTGAVAGMPTQFSIKGQKHISYLDSNGEVISYVLARRPALTRNAQTDICTFTFTLNDEVQNFKEGTNLGFSHYYPAGDLLAVTDKGDTLFVVSEVCDVLAYQDSKNLSTTEKGKYKLESTIGADDLTPFGFSEDHPLDIYYSEEKSNIWQYVGPAGTTTMVDKMGSYMMATSIKNDVLAPEIVSSFDEQTGKVYFNVTDNIGVKVSTLHVTVNGEERVVTMINPSNFELSLTDEDLEYRIAFKASIYDIAGNRGETTQIFQLDKPEKININILPDTDISQLENTIYIGNVSAEKGKDMTLSVKMKNSVVAEGFQFDLELPEGVTVAKDADGFAEAYLSTERTTTRKTNTFDADFQDNGALRVMAGSTNGSTLNGNDGEVATIKLNVASNVPIGSYPIVLRNISISDSGANSYDVTLVKSTMTVTSNVLGDVNGDGYLTMADVSALVDFIMGKNPSPFDKKLADVNKDGDINVADVTELLKVFNTEYFH